MAVNYHIRSIKDTTYVIGEGPTAQAEVTGASPEKPQLSTSEPGPPPSVQNGVKGRRAAPENLAKWLDGRPERRESGRQSRKGTQFPT